MATTEPITAGTSTADWTVRYTAEDIWYLSRHYDICVTWENGDVARFNIIPLSPVPKAPADWWDVWLGGLA
jgi:hypothetical protein